MRKGEASPTATETYTSLMKICEISQRGIRDLGKIEGKNALGSEEELRRLVLDVSKKIIETLPTYQFEREDIDHAEAVLCTLLNRVKLEGDE